MAQSYTDTVVSTPDPPSTGVHNPIHDAEGADAAGYAGALVAGVRTYGWAAATITRALGPAWLSSGWVDFSLRRPLYAGERLHTVVTADAGNWSVACRAEGEQEDRVVLDGAAGLGAAPWLNELQPPTPGKPTPSRDNLPSYDLSNVPLRQPLRPLGAYVSAQAAQDMVAHDLGLRDSHYLQPQTTPGPIHPYFLAARIAPLTRHNFTYGPTIHVRSQIQHVREASAEREIVVSAQIVDAYERRGHWYQVLDGVVSDDQGELARIRHHTIFRPRGAAKKRETR